MRRLSLPDGSALAFDDRGDGTALLLIHGFTGSRRAWPDSVVDGLAARWRVIAPDLIGHGESDRDATPGRYALERVLCDLCALLDACAIERAHWVGYSMGGRIALAAGLRCSERVHTLVLEGSSPGLADPEERATRRAQDAELARSIEKDGVHAFAARWMEQPLFATQRSLPAPLRARQLALRRRNDAASLAACLAGLGTGTQPSFWGELGTLARPALLIAGEHDTKFLALARRMQRALPAAHLACIAGAGHTTHLEQPERYLKALSDFLARSSQGGDLS